MDCPTQSLSVYYVSIQSSGFWDSQPSTFEAEQGKWADVFIHEIFPSAEEFAHYNHMPIEAAEGVMEEHTTPSEPGQVYTIAKPRLGVGSHFTLDDNLIDPLFQRWRTTYDGPVLLMQAVHVIGEAASGGEALQLIEIKAPDVLLLDISMTNSPSGPNRMPGQMKLNLSKTASTCLTMASFH